MSTPTDSTQFKPLVDDAVKIPELTSTLGTLYRNIYKNNNDEVMLLNRFGIKMIEQCPQLLENVNNSRSCKYLQDESLTDESLTDEQIGEYLIRTVDIFTQSDETFSVLQSLIENMRTGEFSTLNTDNNKS